MAKSMATAAKVPARPWPLMKMALYFWGSSPTRPNRLPCSTAPKAAGGRKHARYSGDGPAPGPAPAHSQLMNQMVAMVTEKKRSWSMGTLTSAAVTVKSSSMKSRLPAMRTASETLPADKRRWVRCGRVPGRGRGGGGASAHLW